MTKYIRVQDQAYPFTERDIKNLFPNTSFPKPFRAEGFDVVFPVPKPVCTNLQMAVEGEPNSAELGHWEQTWNIVDKFKDIPDGLTKEEQEAAYLAQELSIKQASQKAKIKKEVSSYIGQYYDTGQQNSIQTLLIAGTEEQKTGAGLIWAWIKTVLDYYYGKKVSIDTDINTSWDFSIFDNLKPDITLESLITGEV